ncbi:MAG TPA: matrixin family metalloprotease [Pyrinomonadaceae bacterium]|nr:matrixin family metalloprotease [Pyrinomonadaceae bacterium]
MKAVRYIVTAVLLTTLVASTGFASPSALPAGKTDPQRLSWRAREIRIALSTSLRQSNSNLKFGRDVWGAVRRSLDAWESVADIEFLVEESDRQSLSPSGNAGDGISLITIAPTPENVLLFSNNFEAESAKTRVFYNGKGFITEADIVLNPFQQFSTDGTFGTFDLQATLTHEIGHLLGLQHSDVLGATMSNSLSRNGTFGILDFGSRTLSASDIAAVRALYGTTEDGPNCCSAVAGKLTVGTGRGAKGIRVWAEEVETGRVVAQAETASDGSFRLGGLEAATYSLFWQRSEDNGAVGELGLVVLTKGESRSVDEKIVAPRSDLSLKYIGVNSQLTDFAVPVMGGRQYIIFLGGSGLDPENVRFGFSSPFFEVSPGSVITRDFGSDVSVVSFVLTVADGAPHGMYSVFAYARDGSRTSLIGALSVE